MSEEGHLYYCRKAQLPMSLIGSTTRGQMQSLDSHIYKDIGVQTYAASDNNKSGGSGTNSGVLAAALKTFPKSGQMKSALGRYSTSSA